ncbi:penicillin acylase family protein [Massilia atriviolacea]|uniref:Penicillin acylase family protein n=2 Tax=Massilia atriviolacea TaxID=2495579 RepID=A0A430HSP1_9BURK|nr:penicillin acylase family protein [Massilia atriviolacea]
MAATLSLGLCAPGAQAESNAAGRAAKQDARQDARQDPRRAGSGVEIRRTTDGIPHLRAASWRGLGTGAGYVQAEDALCTLADGFVTYEGRRSWYFGADARATRNSTYGKPKNIDSDFFFRAFADQSVTARYRAAHPAELNQLIEGYAAGYNRFLADARAKRVGAAGRTCLDQPWVRPIGADDIFRRMYAAQVGAGYARFVAAIANAGPAAPATADAVDANAVRATLAQRIGDQPGIGSNMLALGREATGEAGAVLLGNPHWFWGGPDRFYQMHLTIPGRFNAAGVALLGIPVIMIGFNENVAWSHTVSAARRFGLFDLALEADQPTRYVVDGASEAMRGREFSVDVRGEDGAARRVTRTLYGTRFGPVLDLAASDPAFGWGKRHALAIRDVNADNFRIFRNFFYWNQASSLDDFIAIQRREAAAPWINTMAIARGDGRIWYGDIGAVPNVPDSLREACATPLAKGFARVDPLTPFLDASRSECGWRSDGAAVQAGAMPASAQPWLLREDYVANMNDSYWLSNARQPLEGFPSVLGGERTALELRGRLGHRIAAELLAQPASSAATVSRQLRQAALSPRIHSAELFRDELLAQACTGSQVVLDPASLKAAGAKPDAAPEVDLADACRTLRAWSGQGDADDRGALLWEAFWGRLRTIPAASLYGTAFSGAAPLDTPAKPTPTPEQAGQALGAAVRILEGQGVALDAALGSRRYVDSGGRQVPLYGGCHTSGYFAVACNYDGSYRLGPDSMGNAYLQVVHFGPGGVEAHTLMAHGQDELAVSNGQGSAPVERYARKDWLRFPFHEKEIARDPGLRRSVLRP